MNKQNIIDYIIILVLLGMNLVFIGCSSEFHGYKSYVRKNSAPISFSFEYPSNYRFDPIYSMSKTNQYSIINMASPYWVKEETEKARASTWNIVITNFIPVSYNSVEDYFLDNMKRWQFGENSEIVEQSTVTIDGMTANKVVISYLKYFEYDRILDKQVGGPFPARKIEIYFEHEGIIYEFESDAFQDVLEEDTIYFQHMLDTFKRI